MAEPLRSPNLQRRPLAWLLGAPGTGDNRQLEQLARLLDVEARWISQYDSVARVLRDRVVGFRARAIPADKQDRYQPPWPELVLIVGGRSVIDARRIKTASAGYSRIVCLGRPWAPLDWFDLVITTPQYRLPKAANVIEIDLPLNRFSDVPRSRLVRWDEQFGALPRPLVAVLLGGDSGSFRFRAEDADRLGDALAAVLSPAGAGAVIVASPRTPVEAAPRIRARLNVPARVFDWVPKGPNPMQALLQLADAIVVTSDSASMIAEACDSGKPLAVFDLSERKRMRLARAGRKALPWLQPTLERLAQRGLWFPARDMPELLRRVRQSGQIVPLAELLDLPAGAGIAPRSLEPIVDRVRQLL